MMLLFLRQMGEKCWREHEVSKAPLVVIASHPYHMDPFVNHGICTLIASMASLISYKQMARRSGDIRGRYLGVFTLWNVIFLAILLVPALL